MDINFYTGLPDECAQSVDAEFMDSQEAYGGYSEGNKFTEGGDSYLTIDGTPHHFLNAEQTFHTPSLGDEVFEIPPISLDPDSSLTEAVSHFQLVDGSGAAEGPPASNLAAEAANDPSFAATFVSSGSPSLEHLDMGATAEANGGALLSSSSLELGESSGSHFSSSSPMTIDVQLGDMAHGLMGSSQLTTINQTELVLGLEEGGHSAETSEQKPLSPTSSPGGSLQDEDMDDFKRSVLVDSPMSQSSSQPAVQSSVSAKRALGSPGTAQQLAVAAKKGRKKKDPNEPQKPVSAYALFFRDTQAAIKGQNPNASFGEVSKIVASMWDSLAEEQKQVYKRKTDTAKKEYLKALAAYRANQLSQPPADEEETSPSPPPPEVTQTPAAVPSVGQQVVRPLNEAEQNTITNICASNIILDVPEMATRSRTGANKPMPTTQAITKIIIPKHMLQAGARLVTLLPGGVHGLQPTLLLAGGPRLPPPLQQMQNAPPPPPLQQMAPAPPRLQAKPREGGSAPVFITVAQPPPLKIKILPASFQKKDLLSVIVPVTVNSTLSSSAPAATVRVVNSAVSAGQREKVISEALPSDEDEMEVTELCDGAATCVCVRSGCTNPAVESQDWDKEYCSNECVASHCSDIFKAWCSFRNQTLGMVK
ncbi:TOX high mobility group box family member 4-A-like [Entelurus aequoreus]|uniref:TOX high mobility group box family member 4-A-like n=1 Tax=Entelurus aequoreus TaxID=161455 RepID=UPI002B1CE335|nr:TOX high mobility group box family member 4-A-like [Entelurus aequoreus]